MGIVTFGSVFGDALKRAGQRVPQAYLTYRELEDRAAQSAMQQQEKVAQQRDMAENKLFDREKFEEGKRQFGITNERLSKPDPEKSMTLADMEAAWLRAQSPDVQTQYFKTKSGLMPKASSDTGGASGSGGPTPLSQYNADKARFQGRQGDILSRANIMWGNSGYGPDTDIKTRAGLEYANQTALGRRTNPGWLSGLFGAEPESAPDSSFLPLLQQYQAYDDSLSNAYNRTFGGGQGVQPMSQQSSINEPPPPNDGSMSAEEYAEFVKMWQAGYR